MTMRRAHYTWRNDPGTTNKWRSVTVVTNLCSTITYLAPAPITNYISQTRRQGRKNSTQFWVQKGKSVFSLSSRFVPHIDTDFSRLFWALAEGEATGECQRFSTFALIFICHISSKSVSWDGKRNRSFWHIPSCTPGILPSLPLSMYISISALDIQSFCLGDSAQIRAPLILLFAYSNVTFLCYSNFQFVIFKYFKLNLIIGDFSEADIRFSHLPFTFEQISWEKTFWMDSLINFVTKEIFRISKYFPFENVSKCVFLMKGQTWEC